MCDWRARNHSATDKRFSQLKLSSLVTSSLNYSIGFLLIRLDILNISLTTLEGVSLMPYWKHSFSAWFVHQCPLLQHFWHTAASYDICCSRFVVNSAYQEKSWRKSRCPSIYPYFKRSKLRCSIRSTLAKFGLKVGVI